MRRLGCHNDRINAPLAGFISGLSMLIDASSRRMLITILTMSRAIETSIKVGETDGFVPILRYKNLLLWLAANLWL